MKLIDSFCIDMSHNQDNLNIYFLFFLTGCTCLHAYLHTHIHSCIFTYMHAWIYMYMQHKHILCTYLETIETLTCFCRGITIAVIGKF